MLESLFQQRAVGAPAPFNAVTFSRRLYQAEVPDNLLTHLHNRHGWDLEDVVRDLHGGWAIAFVRRNDGYGDPVPDELERAIGDRYLLIFAAVAMNRCDDLHRDLKMLYAGEVEAFIESLERDGYRFANGRIFNQEGHAITAEPIPPLPAPPAAPMAEPEGRQNAERQAVAVAPALVPKLSLEALFGLLLEIIVGILDHLHVGDRLIVWVLFAVGVVLILDSIFRSDWMRKREGSRWKRMAASFIPTAILLSCFGLWINRHKTPAEAAPATRTTLLHDSPAPPQDRQGNNDRAPRAHSQAPTESSKRVGRHLTDAQRKMLNDFAKSLPSETHIYVYAVGTSNESQRYGKEIWEAMGGSAIKGAYVIWAADLEPVPRGIIISTQEGLFPTTDRAAYELGARMFMAGMPNTSKANFGPVPDNGILVIVGPKPDYD